MNLLVKRKLFNERNNYVDNKTLMTLLKHLFTCCNL